MAVGQAQLGNVESIEVTDRLFRFLCRDHTSKYITYGQPGIKVYPVGTKDGIDKVESMSADKYYEFLTKQKAEDAKKA